MLEFTTIKIVEELPEVGNNYSIYLLENSETEVFEPFYFKKGEWVQIPLIPEVEDNDGEGTSS